MSMIATGGCLGSTLTCLLALPSGPLLAPRLVADPAYDRAHEAELAIFRPLFTTAFLLDDFFAEQEWFGAKSVVCSSASSKTALGLAQPLKDAGIPILGTTPEAIDLAEERGAFAGILERAGLVAPRNGTAIDEEGAIRVAEEIGYPVLVRPSFVLGGRGMEIVYDTESLRGYFDRIEGHALVGPGYPLLVDRFLDDAIEITR